MCGGRRGSASALRAAGDTPTATCVTVCVHVCVNAYVSAFLGNDKQSWLPQDHVVTTGMTTTATAAAAAAAAVVDQLLLYLKLALDLVACQRGPYPFVLL